MFALPLDRGFAKQVPLSAKIRNFLSKILERQSRLRESIPAILGNAFKHVPLLFTNGSPREPPLSLSYNYPHL